MHRSSENERIQHLPRLSKLRLLMGSITRLGVGVTVFAAPSTVLTTAEPYALSPFVMDIQAH